MSQKWYIPLILILPFIPALLWGVNLPDTTYAALRIGQEITSLDDLRDAALNGATTLATPLFPLAVGVLIRSALEPALVAFLLSTLGWGVGASLIAGLGQKLDVFRGALAAAVLFTFNPWIIPTLGQATGWIIALVWLLLNLIYRKRFIAAVAGILLLLAIFFRPAHGFIWPGDLGAPLLWSFLLFAAAVGVERLAFALSERETIALDSYRTTNIFLVLLLLVVGLWQANQLWQDINLRPVIQWSVEEEVADWLREQAESGDSVLADERVAYLSGLKQAGTTPDQLQERVVENAPDYVVTGATLPWQMLREAIWFRLFYEPQASFGDTAVSPVQIWALRGLEAWPGLPEPLNARVPDRLSLLGYQMDPQPAVSGEALNLTLHMQRPRASLIDPSPFQAVLRLVSPLGGETIEEWAVDLPGTLPAETWQAEQVIAERLRVELPADIAAGAYLLNLSLRDDADAELWPFSFNNDVNRLDRVPLGYVTIPWDGDMSGALPITADFAQGIQLAAADYEAANPGESLPVTLYWQVSTPVDEVYSVFVHLLDENGQLVANHDGPPEGALFPTDSWLPGMVVPDTHPVPLPGDLAPGTYELRVGLYDPQTGERLPLQLIDGQAVEGDSVSLGFLEVTGS